MPPITSRSTFGVAAPLLAIIAALAIGLALLPAAPVSAQAPQPQTEQSYIQAPQEPRTGPPGTTFDITVLGFDQPEENPAPVDIALFPCDVADPVDPNDNTFRDADSNGFADGVGTTTTGNATISSLHGDPDVSTRHLDDASPDAQDQIPYEVHSAAEDCALHVVFHDVNSNDQLDVDADGRPLEHWNYGLERWQAQDEGVTPARVSGPTRFHTAAAIATLDHDTSQNVFIASGEDFPDALAASFAAGTAGAEQGPILLTGYDDLTDATRDALTELAPERVFVIGGPDAIHPDVVDELEGRGYEEVVRVSGATRYETAAALAFGWGTGPDGNVGTLDGDRTALMASGTVFPDALSAGPVAARAELPLFLTPPDRAHPEADRRLADLDIQRIVVIGGEGAVSSDVVLHYQQLGYEVERWGGRTRTDTATVVADNAVERLGFDPTLSLLARGDTFPDALTASVHAGLNAAPMVLTATPTVLSNETRSWLIARCPAIDAIRALGGTAAVSATTLDEAVQAAGQCLDDSDPQPHTEQSYIQSPQEARTGSPGDTFEVTVTGFDADNPAPVDIALFPCDVADPVDPNDNTFRDADSDGFADGLATTTTGSAVISHPHAADARHVDSVGPDQETNRFTYVLDSASEDCVINVVFHDANNNDQLDVDAQGRPLEHWNYGLHEWRSTP